MTEHPRRRAYAPMLAAFFALALLLPAGAVAVDARGVPPTVAAQATARTTTPLVLPIPRSPVDVLPSLPLPLPPARGNGVPPRTGILVYGDSISDNWYCYPPTCAYVPSGMYGDTV